MPQRAPVVMSVDDEPRLRSLLGEYFCRHGYAVQAAADAATARAMVAEGRPDLAILDLNLPGENGLSLARWLREAHPGVAVVMLTTAGEAVDRIVGLELGADDYIPKPIEVRELLARVRAVLRRSQTAQAAPTATGSAAMAAAGAVAGTAPHNAPGTRRVPFGRCTLDVDQRWHAPPDSGTAMRRALTARTANGRLVPARGRCRRARALRPGLVRRARQHRA